MLLDVLSHLCELLGPSQSTSDVVTYRMNIQSLPMPHLPFAQNIFRLRLTGTVGTQNWASIQYARFIGPPPTVNDCNTIATSLTTAWQNALASLCSTTVHLRLTEVIDLTSDVTASGSHAQDVPGTRTGISFPNQVCGVVSYKINRRYRGGHPRTYWPVGVQPDTTNGNLWSSSFLPLLNNGGSAFVGNVNAIQYSSNPLQHGCLSYYIRDPNRPGHSMLRDTPVFFPTQTVVAHSRIDTQRRRLGKEIS